MICHAQGGNDTFGGAVPPQYINGGNSTSYGDAQELHDQSAGGNDVFYAGMGVVTIYGDGDLYDSAQGGNDQLVSSIGAAPNGQPGSGYFYTFDTHSTSVAMYGDGLRMQGSSHGGNDLLSGSSTGNDTLYGDARYMSEDARGGNDALFGGGERAPGYDTFGFAGHFGNDIIQDFHKGVDKIEFDGAGVSSFADLQISRSANGDTVITAPGHGTVTLPDSGPWPFDGAVTPLTTSDFIFAA